MDRQKGGSSELPLRTPRVHFNVILPTVLLKQLTFIAAWAIASRVNGLSVVASKSSDTEKGKLFSSGPMASGDLPAVQYIYSCLLFQRYAIFHSYQ
jgi:hypothetical protein